MTTYASVSEVVAEAGYEPGLAYRRLTEKGFSPHWKMGELLVVSRLERAAVVEIRSWPRPMMDNGQMRLGL